MSILEDYDHDFSDIEEEIISLCTTAQAISNFGINPTAIAVMKTTKLLSGTSLDAIAIEDYGFHHKNDNESRIALESILEKIKERAVTWSSKITTFFKEKASKVGSTIKELFEKLKEGVKSTKEKVFSKVSKAKDFVKAHPYKTLAMVATAAVAVLGIIGFVGKNIPSYKESEKLPEVMSKTSKMISSIKWPFGEITPKLSKNGKRISLAIAGTVAAATVGTVAKLGWTSNNADSLVSIFGKVNNGFKSLWDAVYSKSDVIVRDTKTIITGMGRGIVEGAKAGADAVQPLDAPNSAVGKLVNVIGTAAGAGAGAALMAFGIGITSLIYVLYQLVKVILIGGLRLVVSTMNRLKEGKPENPAYV